MANKRQRKKRMKKLKLMEKQSPVKQQQLTSDYLPPYKEPIVSNIDYKQEKQKAMYQYRLDKVYKGSVVALSDYINPNAVIVHKCTDCGLVFFGKPSHMVGKEHQQHNCNMPYGDRLGFRLQKVSSGKKFHKKSKKDVGDKFSKMVWEDYTPQEIAKELGIPYKMVLDYFKDEGLI